MQFSVLGMKPRFFGVGLLDEEDVVVAGVEFLSCDALLFPCGQQKV